MLGLPHLGLIAGPSPIEAQKKASSKPNQTPLEKEKHYDEPGRMKTRKPLRVDEWKGLFHFFVRTQARPGQTWEYRKKPEPIPVPNWARISGLIELNLTKKNLSLKAGWATKNRLSSRPSSPSDISPLGCEMWIFPTPLLILRNDHILKCSHSGHISIFGPTIFSQFGTHNLRWKQKKKLNYLIRWHNAISKIYISSRF